MGQQRTAATKTAELTPTGKSPLKQKSVCPPFGSFQRAVGNQAFSRMLQSRAIQAKLTVGSQDDAFEKEADRVADVVDSPSSQFVFAGSAGSKVQRKGAHAPADATPVLTVGKSGPSLESSLGSGSAGGRALDPDLRSYMESRIGADFSGVRIHTGAQSAAMNEQLNSLAFTHGRDIHFGGGKYDPHSGAGRRLIAHELAHVVQQGASASSQRVQRQGEPTTNYTFQVPADVKSVEELFRLFDIYIFGEDKQFTWHPQGADTVDLEKLRGKRVLLTVSKASVESSTDPKIKTEREKSKQTYGGLKGKEKEAISAEANKRYYKRSGDKPGTKIKPGDEGQGQIWDQALADVLKDKEKLKDLPPAMKELMGPEGSYQPADYERLMKIAEKLRQFTAEDLAAYKLLTVRATSDLDLFEKSVDMFLARREELKKALGNQVQQPAQDKKDPTLQDEIAKQWKDLDEGALATMTEDERYALARKKTNELTVAQLKYMKDHPGETAKDFAKSALLMNTGETFKGIGEDLKEAANGDANSWARWAAGTGAGAKLSGWMLAVAGVLFVASWLTGVGELATIAAGAGILLGATLTLSVAETELRVKAASQAKNPADFKRNVELAAAAQANVAVGVALIVVAAVLHFTAKAAFPETMKRVSTSIKNFRERIRLKGSIYEIKPGITAEMNSLKGELGKVSEAAKQKSIASGDEIAKLTAEQFAEKLDKGDGGFLDQSKLKPEQKINFSELLKSPEGRAAIETYRAKLVNALKVDVPGSIDRMVQEYASKIDDFVKDVDAAKNHDELKAAADKIDGNLSEEHAKQYLAGEQEKLTKQKVEEGAQELKKKIDDQAKADADLAAAQSKLAKDLESAGLGKGKAAEQTAKWAAGAGIIDRVQKLLELAKKGLYGNPKQLPKMIEIIGKGAKQHIQAIDDAIGRMEKGHKVDIEAEADVVDHTEKEAIQHKNVAVGKSVDTLGDNIKSALKQLAGKGNASEVPPKGYKRVADIKITLPENPHFKADGATLQKYLNDMKALSDRVGADIDADPNAKLEGLGGDLQVRITNANGTFTFDGPDFKLVK